MLQAAERHLESLPSGHPCQGCEVRDKAVCGVLDCDNLEQFRNLGWSLKLGTGRPCSTRATGDSRIHA